MALTLYVYVFNAATSVFEIHSRFLELMGFDFVMVG